MFTSHNEMTQGDKMSTDNSFKFFIASIGIFAAGIAAGLLLSPKSGRENREYIRQSTDHAGKWVQSKRDEAQMKAHKVTDKVKRSVKEHVPDLYEATNSLQMNDEDLKTARELN